MGEYQQPVIVVWNKDGKFFQIWTADFNGGDGIEHGKYIAKMLGGTYQIFPKESPSLLESET